MNPHNSKQQPASKSIGKNIFIAMVLLNPVFSFTDDDADLVQVSDHLKLNQISLTPASGSCGLKNAGLIRQDSHWAAKKHPKDLDFGTATVTYFETSDPSCLKDYAVVQYVKGCVWETWAADGSTKNNFAVRDLAGKSVPTHFTEWTVDSDDLDPIYSTNALAYTDRHALYLTTSSGKSPKLPIADEMLLQTYNRLVNPQYYKMLLDQTQAEKSNFAYVMAKPAGGSYKNIQNLGSHAVNSSLQFKSCIYRTKDIPTSGAPAGFDASVDDGGPVTCFDWNSSHIWDDATKTMTHPEEIDGQCSGPAA